MSRLFGGANRLLRARRAAGGASTLLDDLLAWYALANANDAHTNGYNLTAVGTPAYGAAKLGDGMTTAGLATNGAGLDVSTGDFSVAFWAYWASANNGNSLYYYTNFDNGAGAGVCLRRIAWGRSIRVRIGDGTNTATQDFSNGFAAADTWGHVCVTFARGGNATVYANGTSLGTLGISSVTGDISVSALKFAILAYGTDASTAVAEPAGRVDEFGIWSRALTSDEVAELYNLGDGIGYGDL